ncbi:ASCH domain-containing protein [Winogradskyella eckloniae]|uniref:ASCH domain-containing protein n=1 Tax=Winogradskyella eckloniae TaxID=1089306 RepID=UPI001564EE39|nr:ASCH domain-containing protein [Winogradskyella eckloniae]NRD21509.1 ASCH domain-containing protein [Winogradskyella eckloniae]
MKKILILLIVLPFSCKDATTSNISNALDIEQDTLAASNLQDNIDQSVIDIWQDYLKEHPEFKSDRMPESWFFHNNEADANRLAELVLKGKKKASSGLYYMYKAANVGLPAIGTKHIITDFSGKAKAIIQTTKVDTIPFNKISEAYAALDMGTDIEPLDAWKKAHWEFFSSVFNENNTVPTENMLVVCEWFEMVYKQ